MTALKIIAFTLLLIGSLINYGAKLIVKRLNLFEKIDADEAEELMAKNLSNIR